MSGIANQEEFVIELGIGSGSLQFGATRQQVRELLGEPDATRELDIFKDGTEVLEMWDYRALRLECTFDKDDNFRLGSLQTAHPHATLDGAKLIGLAKNDALLQCSTLNLGPAEIEPLVEGVIQITFEQVSMTLFVRDGVVDELHWGHLWIDEETPKWIV